MINQFELKVNKKAFEINMTKPIYGTFAEIGAGQEVARRFFHVGGAAGTVAKTISAYDMTFSDAIYGKSSRFVSRQRLGEMLDHEYALLIERLDEKFGAERTFFACGCQILQISERLARLDGHPFSEQPADRA